MAKHELISKMSRSVHMAGLKLEKNMPKILVVVGTIGAVTSTVMACKATLKVNEVLDEAKTTIDKIHTATEEGVTEAGREYTPEDGKKELTITYAQTGVKLAKLYGPAVVLGVASIGCFITSHNMLNKRLVASAAAYTAVEKAYKEYRGRVVERFGDELDKELKYNIKAREVEETIVDDEGNEHTVSKVINVADPYLTSPYAVFFDEYCSGWTKDPERNLFFLLQQQNAANMRLRDEGYLSVNDVYTMIGVPKKKSGVRKGWIYDPKKDGYQIDLGIYNIHREASRNFVNGYEPSILLDPNVEGDILFMMED